MATNQPTRVPGESAKPPAQPGETVAGTAAAAVASAQASTSESSLGVNPVKVTRLLQGTPEQQIAASEAEAAELRRQLADLLAASQSMLKELNAKNAQAAVPPPAKLPTMAEAKADVDKRLERGESVHAVLTTEGHYVHPLAGYQSPAGQAVDAKTLANLAAAIINAQRSAAESEAIKPKTKAAIMEPGTAPKDD